MDSVRQSFEAFFWTLAGPCMQGAHCHAGQTDPDHLIIWVSWQNGTDAQEPRAAA